MKRMRGIVPYIYVSLWFLYGLQQTLLLKGIVAQLIFVVLMAMSFYACYKVNRYYNIGPYIKWLNVMLMVLTIYGVILMMNGGTIQKGSFANNSVNSYAYLQHIYMSVMPIYSFYYYMMKRQLTARSVLVVFGALSLFAIMSYYQHFFKTSARLEKEDVVNNMGYLFVPLIPMLSLVRIRLLWKCFLALVLFGFIMLSMKRGAILAGVVVLLLFLKHHFKMRTKTQFASAIIILLTVVFVIYKFVMNLYATNAFFQRRLLLTMGGYASRRDVIYDYLWHYYIERTSAWEFFFGHGAYGTVSIYVTFAHNDWLEFAINQGVLGIFMYIVYWVVFVWEWKNYQGPKSCRATLGDIIIAYFLITLFSMSFGNMPLAATFCIGYCLAVNRKRKYVILNEDTRRNT